MKAQWNFAAICALLVLLMTNGVAAWALFHNVIDFKEWLAATGSVNGAALGWVAALITRAPAP